MGSGKWLGGMLAWAVVGTALADEREMKFLVTPSIGFTSIGVDGGRLDDGSTRDMDQIMTGLSVGVRTPIGLQFEIGKSVAESEVIFDWYSENFSYKQSFALVGYSFEFADAWRLAPKLGYAQWRLRADNLDFLDADGNEREKLRGEDWMFEFEVAREFGNHFALGLSLQAIDVPYGNTYSIAVTTGLRF